MKAPSYIIRQAREELGLSQRALATKAQLSTRTILKAERGGEITPRTWKKLRDALNISVKPREDGEYILMF